MFIDAAAIIAILSDENEAERCSDAVVAPAERFTSAIAVWEAAVALARPDKFAISVDDSRRLVIAFLEQRDIAVRDLPDPSAAVSLSLDAAMRFRSGPNRLNLADCFHYACARHYAVPMLSTADEFRLTDLETIP
ncbi:MAG: type II toxin-antitoxin system VapC family toxin [Mesorhizobium sp.]|uniref:type II toxin-antitoxin system VapC family toxin n=1 Tax=Mesorhizobium sp. TaxID=1871066 RepID=UPI0011F85A0E|nr:type II toxin-antitoxin system VapC family toxin [Mesorhizobium sp.]TIO19032.1 MAG: type II toxin-antitoxin system VapC family toxin [Mesorhizobium sp.]